MKLLVIALVCLSSLAVYAQSDIDAEIAAESAGVETEEVLTSETINVDGYLKDKPATDGELEGLNAEIRKQKTETILNKEKAKSYQQLSQSVEKLSETTEEYLEEKRAAKEEIANYNNKVKCLTADAPGPECDKYKRRR